MYERNPTAPDIPAWLIVDQNYRNRYLFKDVAPTLAFPGSWYDSGAAHKAWTLDALAGRIGMPAAALRATVNRFNSLALSGDDTDFQRGDSTYDHYYTDPAIVPNSCLAPCGWPRTTLSRSSRGISAPREACARTHARVCCARTAR